MDIINCDSNERLLKLLEVCGKTYRLSDLQKSFALELFDRLTEKYFKYFFSSCKDKLTDRQTVYIEELLVIFD